MTKKIAIVLSFVLLAVLASGCAKKTSSNNETNMEKTISDEESAASQQSEANQATGDEKVAEAPAEQQESPEITTETTKKNPQAIVSTNYGNIAIELFEADAPLTVANFIKLSEEGFYDGTKFHRVIKGFMIQGGDPNSNDNNWADDGTGGPGYTVPAEIGLKNVNGAVATARIGDEYNPKRESSGSQFFINVADNDFLDGQYTVFGQVVSGMEAAGKIEGLETNSQDHPTTDATIEKITIVK